MAHWPRVVHVVRHLRPAPLEAGYRSTRSRVSHPPMSQVDICPGPTYCSGMYSIRLEI
jgi:hypothetical protein